MGRFIFADRVAADMLDQHQRQLAREPGAVELFRHPHQRHADALGARFAQPPQQFHEAEREQLAVQIPGQLIDVGDGQHERHRSAIQFGDADQFGIDDRLQLLAGIGDFGRGQRDIAPIVRPGVVEQVEDDRHFVVEFRLVDRANADARVLLPRRDQPRHDPLCFGPDVDFIGQQVLGLGVACALDPALIRGKVMPHHDHRRLVEARDQQAGLVPDRQADRAHGAGHALRAKPLLGGRDQRGGRLAVERLEHPPLAGPGAHMLEHQLVDLRADPADDGAVALRQPQHRAGVLEPGILLRVDQPVDLVLERRDPRGIVAVDVPGEVHELLAVGLGDDRPDGYATHQPALRRSIVAPTADNFSSSRS